jgi:Flp pilus assembly protein TadG
MNIKKHSSERGQVLVIIVFAMFGLIGMTGLAIDGSRAYSERRHAQNAADTAALAAALAYVRTPDGAWTDVGYSRAASNGYDNNGTSNLVDVYHPPVEGPYAGNTDYVQVIITSHLPTLFGRVVGIEEVTNTVQAVAKVDPSIPTELYDGNAIVGLAPHECKAVKYQGNANTTVTGGGLFVNSDCSTAAFFNNSSSASLTAPSLTVVGDEDHKDGALNVGTITENAQDQAKTYPPREYILPKPDCSDDATVDGETMTPGNWSGTFPPAHVKYLEAGFYCVNSGDFKLNAGDYLEGHNVLIYMVNGKVTWNGGATVKLYAPETEPYKGLLLYLPITNTSTVTINGNSDSKLEGAIMAPASAIEIKGTGDAGMIGQVIGYTVDLGGTSGINIHYDNSKVLQLLTSPSIELKQ